MIDFKKVAKLLPKCKAATWYRGENTDYLIGDYWGLKTNKDLSQNKDISIALFKKFGQISEIDSSVKLSVGGQVTVGTYDKYLLDRLNTSGHELGYIKGTGLFISHEVHGDLDILAGNDYYVAIQRKFAEMFDLTEDCKLKGSGKTKPVVAISDDETLMVYPVILRGLPEFLIKLEKEKR